jgi:hypothetical protein
MDATRAPRFVTCPTTAAGERPLCAGCGAATGKRAVFLLDEDDGPAFCAWCTVALEIQAAGSWRRYNEAQLREASRRVPVAAVA